VYIHYTANIVMADSFLLARVYPFNLDLDLELDSGCIHVDTSGAILVSLELLFLLLPRRIPSLTSPS